MPWFGDGFYAFSSALYTGAKHQLGDDDTSNGNGWSLHQKPEPIVDVRYATLATLASLAAFTVSVVMVLFVHRQRGFSNTPMYGYATLAASGILLSTTFLHIVPEALDDLTQALLGYGVLAEHSYRIGFVLFFSGYIAVFFSEAALTDTTNNSSVLFSPLQPQREKNTTEMVDLMESTAENDESAERAKRRQLLMAYRWQLASVSFLYVCMAFHSFASAFGSSFASRSNVSAAFLIISYSIDKLLDSAIVSELLERLQVGKVVYFVATMLFAAVTPVGILLRTFVTSRNDVLVKTQWELARLSSTTDINVLEKTTRSTNAESGALVFMALASMFSGGIFLEISLDMFRTQFITTATTQNGDSQKARKFAVFSFFFLLVAFTTYADD
jgi:hypothetical protein